MTKLDRALMVFVVVCAAVLVIHGVAEAAPGKGNWNFLLDLLWWIRR